MYATYFAPLPAPDVPVSATELAQAAGGGEKTE